MLKINGKFEMLTDDENYSEEVKNVLGSHEALELTEFEINPSRKITTKYERKWLEEGKKIFRLTFSKTKKFTVSRRTSNEMHIKINHEITEEKISALKNISGKDESKKSYWRFGKYFVSSEDEKKYLLETLTSDEEFEQRFYINISKRDEGFLVRLDKTSDAFLTPAVRFALNDAASKL